VIPDLTTCRIYSIDGKKVFEQIINGIVSKIDISSLPKGMYILSLDGDGLHHVQKLAVSGK
jgi:hypothetical protein